MSIYYTRRVISGDIVISGDMTYILLKFIETEKQWNLIKNSYNALSNGKIAIHVLDNEELESKTPFLPNGLFSVPLTRWKKQMEEGKINFKEISVKYGFALVLEKPLIK